MTTTNILLVGNNEQQVNNWMKVLDRHEEWNAVHSLNDEEAIERFHHLNFDVMVLGKDLGNEATRKLEKLFTLQHDEAAVINDSADNNSLENKINGVLAAKKTSKATFSFVDDALKNAGLNITIQ